MFVILDSEEYNKKVQDILDDEHKFKKITRNPVDDLKRKANSLITAANKHSRDKKLPKITGEYKPGYFYGTIKTHKKDNPIRPIISQIPLPTYTLAKTLNEILTPYVPTTYSLRSSAEFVDLLKTSKRQGLLASLDATNLFTNVPVERTIQILINYAYHNSTLPPPEFPDYILESLLRLCTTQAPFRSPTGQMFYQIDGIAMGSPLGVLFAQAFMASVEETVMNELDCKPFMYCRYIDDIITDIQDPDHLIQLKEKLEHASGLKFTSETSLQHKINFLDVSIDATHNDYHTSVFRKPTDTGRCLSGASVCPDRYKISVIRAYVHRALKHCSSWDSFNREVKHIRQLLVNNSYSVSLIDSVANKTISTYLDRQTRRDAPDTTNTLKLYYKNQMSPAYRQDEKALQTIIKRNITPRNPSDKLKLTIYYKSASTRSLILRNNPSNDNSLLKRTHVLYHYTCQKGDCALLDTNGYIGQTTTTLSRRITMHLQQGGILTHNATHHPDDPLTRKDITDNVKVLTKENDPRRLQILEAIYIRKMDPAINRQVNARGVLQLYDGR